MHALFWLAIITMIFASAVAITQTEIKRMLAYSSIAQIGYMVLGVSMLTNLGLQGAVLHLVFHALHEEHALPRGRRDHSDDGPA